MTDEELVPINVAVTYDPTVEKYSFTYSGSSFVTADGTIDLETIPKKTRLSFSLTGGNVPGITFVNVAKEAIWIASGTTPPGGPYRGNQFDAFELSNVNKTVSVSTKNKKKRSYWYCLRCVAPTVTDVIDDDPEIKNGGNNGNMNKSKKKKNKKKRKK